MKKTIFILLISVILASCDTDSFLDVKPTGSLIPETVADFDKLLEDPSNQYYAFYNCYYMDPEVELGPQGDDRLWQIKWKRQYEWAEHHYNEEDNDPSWNSAYQYMYIQNMILDEIDDAPLGTASEADRSRVKGEALAMRAISLYLLVNEYATHYNASNLEAPGVPMPLVIDLQAQLPRSTVGEVYTQIEADLEAAIPLIKDTRPGINMKAKFRPGYASILGLKALIALRKADFANAATYADQALAKYDFLYDKTTWEHKYAGDPWGGIAGQEGIEQLGVTSNKEALWGKLSAITESDPGIYWNQELEMLFDQANDMRYALYSSKNNSFGQDISPYTSYAGFKEYKNGGVSVPMLILCSAEAKARSGNGAGAIAMLNVLGPKRIVGYTPISHVDNASTLRLVLEERRKELCYSIINFMDLKRYHSYGETVPTYTRTIQGQVHTLAPGSDKYNVPIPRNVVNFNPNLDL